MINMKIIFCFIMIISKNHIFKLHLNKFEKHTSCFYFIQFYKCQFQIVENKTFKNKI